MASITGEIQINAPKEKVWEVLADFGGVSKWAPSVTHSVSSTEANRGVGCERQCDIPGFGTLKERVTEWEEGQRISFSVEGVGPMKSMLNEISVSPKGDRTLVTFTVDFRMKFGPVGAIMDRLVVRRQMRKLAELTLAGLKHHVETGELVTPEVLKKTNGAVTATA